MLNLSKIFTLILKDWFCISIRKKKTFFNYFLIKFYIWEFLHEASPEFLLQIIGDAEVFFVGGVKHLEVLTDEVDIDGEHVRRFVVIDEPRESLCDCEEVHWFGYCVEVLWCLLFGLWVLEVCFEFRLGLERCQNAPILIAILSLIIVLPLNFFDVFFRAGSNCPSAASPPRPKLGRTSPPGERLVGVADFRRTVDEVLPDLGCDRRLEAQV